MQMGKRQIQARSLFIMLGIALVVTATAFWSLYRISLERTEVQLTEIARSQARLMEAVAKFDAIHADENRNSRADTLAQIREAQFKYRGFGRTGEIVLVERHGNMVHYLLPEPGLGFRVPEPVSMEGKLSAAAARTLAGESGVMRGPDFTGTEVLAAYEYLPFLDMGLVVKVGMSEIRSPFFQAALITGALAAIALIIGMMLQARMVNPMLKEIFDVNEALKVREQKLGNLSTQLSRYLSPQVYKGLFEGSTTSGIFSRRKKLTIFFSDIVGFTSRTDSMEPEDLSWLLNSYLNAMAELVIKHGGTLDKFIGDAVLVFFGDPESRGVKEDALACMEMALEMQHKISELTAEWERNGISKGLQVRIGITSGYCTVGNFGSDNRMEYTIIGNQVNLASRLQTAAAPGEILMSGETYTLVKSEFECEEKEAITVKGFHDPVRPYRLLGKRAGKNEQEINLSGKGYAVRVDPASIAAGEREEVAATLQQALDTLRQ